MLSSYSVLLAFSITENRWIKRKMDGRLKNVNLPTYIKLQVKFDQKLMERGHLTTMERPLMERGLEQRKEHKSFFHI